MRLDEKMELADFAVLMFKYGADSFSYQGSTYILVEEEGEARYELFDWGDSA